MGVGKRHNSRDKAYILICGTQKAGTTSLYRYLGDHPDICASSVKETGFFLEPSFPFYRQRECQVADGIEAFERYFEDCIERPIRMESTPTYLYSAETPRLIRDSLSDVLLIFLLREPTARLISIYRYLKQIGYIDYRISFEDYVMRQVNRDWQGFPALVTGRYSKYLPNFLNLFSDAEIRIFKFDTLKSRPKWIVHEICQRMDIDPGFFASYDFAVHNPSSAVRSYPVHHLYLKIGQRFSQQRYPHHPGLQKLLASLRRGWERFYNPVILRREPDFSISQDMQSILEDYYRDEKSALAEILHMPEFAWQDS